MHVAAYRAKEVDVVDDNLGLVLDNLHDHGVTACDILHTFASHEDMRGKGRGKQEDACTADRRTEKQKKHVKQLRAWLTLVPSS